MKSFNKKYLYLLVMLTGLFVFACTDSDARLELALQKYVENENKNYPITLDDGTMLDSCAYIAPSTLRYYYVSEYALHQIDTVAIKMSLKSDLVGKMRIDAGSKYFIENEVEFQYNFRDQSANYLFQLEITEKDYKK